MTNAQAGSHSTAPKATAPGDARPGSGLRSRNAPAAGWMVSVALAVLLDEKFRLLGLKPHV
jgi:hypothetical protein